MKYLSILFLLSFGSFISLNKNLLVTKDILEGKYPLDLNTTTLIVEKVDSVGKTCMGMRDKEIYCGSFEKETDKIWNHTRRNRRRYLKNLSLAMRLYPPESLLF